MAGNFELPQRVPEEQIADLVLRNWPTCFNRRAMLEALSRSLGEVRSTHVCKRRPNASPTRLLKRDVDKADGADGDLFRLTLSMSAPDKKCVLGRAFAAEACSWEARRCVRDCQRAPAYPIILGVVGTLITSLDVFLAAKFQPFFVG